MLLTEAGLVAHAIACFAFFALALRSARRGAGDDVAGRWLIGAAVTTGVWALIYVVAAIRDGGWVALLSPAETARTAAWGAFLIAFLAPSWSDRARAGEFTHRRACARRPRAYAAGARCPACATAP